MKTPLNVASVAATLVAVSIAQADTIRLRPSVRVSGEEQYVTLAQIAKLEGNDAAALGSIVVGEMTEPPSTFEITVRDVRGALDAENVHWGRLNLSGNKTVVRPARKRASEPSAVGANVATAIGGPAKIDLATRNSIVTGSQLTSRGDVLGAIGRFFVKKLGVSADELRLELPRNRPEWLELDLSTCEAEVTSDSSPHAARVPIRVRIWRGGNPEPERLVTMKPSVRIPVATLKRAIERGDTIRAGDVELTETWTNPRAMSAPSRIDEIIGRVATRRLGAGDSLRRTDMERACIVKRGQLVKVLCRVGSITVELDATARGDAAMGDAVEVVKPRERTPFLAVVVGPGMVAVERGTASGTTRSVATKE